MDVISYPCWDYIWSMLVKGAPGGEFQPGQWLEILQIAKAYLSL